MERARLHRRRGSSVVLRGASDDVGQNQPELHQDAESFEGVETVENDQPNSETQVRRRLSPNLHQ